MSNDDFNRYQMEQARGKFSRAQYDQITCDEWVALVNALDSVIESQELEIEHLQENTCSCPDD